MRPCKVLAANYAILTDGRGGINRYLKRARSITVAVATTALAAASVLLLVFLAGNRGGGGFESEYRSPTRFAMDTTLEVTIHRRKAELARKDVDAAFVAVRRIESLTSRFKKGSDVWEVNRHAGGRPVKVHPETLEIIERSLELSELTHGAFDITVAPVSELWGFYDRRYRVPSDGEIDNARTLVGYRDVTVDRSERTVSLSRPGMEIDLGAVAKGYAVEVMSALLKKRGVKSGLVNLGGNVGAIGVREDGRPWVIGIRDPRGSPGDIIGEIELSDAFVASSGDYERYFEEGGVRYCHIFDPGTGRQPRALMSTTVVGPDATDVDILSTSLFVMGRKKGFELLKSLPKYEAALVGGDGRVFLSEGMERYVVSMREKI